MNHSHQDDYFVTRRQELRIGRFLDRLHRQPLMSQVRRARFEAVEREGNALGFGLGVEFYDCQSEQRGIPMAHLPKGLPIASVMQRHN